MTETDGTYGADGADGFTAGYRTIHDLASDERPRERLLRHGPDQLTAAELIAIIVGSGTRGENVVDLARSLLEAHGGLAGLLRLDAKALQRTRGLGPAKAAQLAAAIELGRRMPRLDAEDRPQLSSPEAVFNYLRGRLQGRSREELHVLSADRGGRLLGNPAVMPGSVHAISVRTADIFREAIVHEASSVVLVHNHPSGRPTPSPADVTLTREIAAVGDKLGIRLLDHVIIGGERFVSMKRDGLLDA